MPYWIEYWNRKLDGKLGPGVGSDSFQPIDGRASLRTAMAEAERRGKHLPRFEAYRIMHGPSTSRCQLCSSVIPLPRPKAVNAEQ